MRLRSLSSRRDPDSSSLAAAAPAAAAVPHTVQPGETLWSIAAANNLTTRTVAAFNGLPEDGQVVLGSTIKVPTAVEGAAALQNAGVDARDRRRGRRPPPAAAAAPAASGAAPPPAAAWAPTPCAPATRCPASPPRRRVAIAQMAAMNGLDPTAPLLTGTVLKLPTGAPRPRAPPSPRRRRRVVPAADPAPTPTRVGAADIQQSPPPHGVSPSLAAAIAWQESGFNNAMVSCANARGVMQVMPGTWDWVQQQPRRRASSTRTRRPTTSTPACSTSSTCSSRRGGDEATAIAGYYQGLGSVRSRGLFDDTKQYVANVQALRSRFGG